MTKSAPLLVTAIIKSKAQPRGRPFEKGNGYAVKPGEVRNRVGRRGPKPGAAAWAKLLSKGYTANLSSRVPNAIAKEHDLKNVTWAELIAFGMAKAAAKGDTAAAREIREVTEGKLAETMNLTGHIDYTAGQTAKDQLMARITGSGKSSELIESVDEEIFNVDLDNAHALKHPPVQPGRYARSEAHSEPDGQTILLVEDEAMISSNVRECLQQMGYQVVEARNGEAALGSGAGGGDAGARFSVHGPDAEYGVVAGQDYLAGAFAAGCAGPQCARSGGNAEQYSCDWHGLAWFADGDLAAFAEGGYRGEDRGVGRCQRGLPGCGICVVGEFSAEQEHVDELVCAGDGRVVAGHPYAGLRGSGATGLGQGEGQFVGVSLAGVRVECYYGLYVQRAAAGGAVYHSSLFWRGADECAVLAGLPHVLTYSRSGVGDICLFGFVYGVLFFA